MAHLCTATMQNAEQYDTWKEKKFFMKEDGTKYKNDDE